MQWSPWRGLSLSARPDLAGNYTVRAFWQPLADLQLAWLWEEQSTLDLNYRLSAAYTLRTTVRFSADGQPAYDLSLSRSAAEPGGLRWRLGGGHRRRRWGYEAGIGYEVWPGVLAQLDYQSQAGGRLNDGRLQLRLSSELAIAQGRLAPARSSLVGRNRGAIAGRLRTLNPVATLENQLIGVDITATSRTYRTRVKTDAQGNFSLTQLPPDTYVLELDPAHLPFELTPLQTVAIATVAAGAVTPVHFDVRPEFGLAGRILTAEATGASGLQIHLIDLNGRLVQSARTDQFGFYRMDGIPPGQYRLQLPPPTGLTDASDLPERSVDVTDRFLFNQDLTIEQPLSLPALPPSASEQL
jgi:hypothetical protein